MMLSLACKLCLPIEEKNILFNFSKIIKCFLLNFFTVHSHSVQVLFSLHKCKKAVPYEENAWVRYHSGTSYSVVGCTFNVNELIYLI